MTLTRYRASSRANARYVLVTDVSNFYPSIYTHSIPWALHTKVVAKRNRGSGLVGNRLDRWARNAQDQQTKGVPIGPDTSFILAEAILSAVDAGLTAELGPTVGFRYVDDYQLSFQTYNDAEHALAVLEKILGDFELQINPRKTDIVSLPAPMEDAWVREMRAISLRDTPVAQGNDLMSYFSRAFQLARDVPTASVLRYAIGRIRYMQIHPSNLRALQLLSFQAASSEPGTTQHLLAILSDVYAVDPSLILRDHLERFLNGQIESHAPFGHGGEVAWCLWAATVFGVTIGTVAGVAVSEMDDNVVALLALYAHSQGLIPSLDTTRWASLMTAGSLTDENWLLAYEAYEKGWLPSANGQNYVAQDPAFRELRKGGVYFFDSSPQRPSVPLAALPIPGGPGLPSPV